MEYDEEIVERLWDASEQPPNLEASEEAREHESGTSSGVEGRQRMHGPRTMMRERVLGMVRDTGCDTERAVL